MEKEERYDEKFKENAVRLSYRYGNIMKTARELGIPYALLYNWRRERPVMRVSFSNKEEKK